MNNVIPKPFSIHNASLMSPVYYQEIMKLCNKFLNFPTFPILDSKKVYMTMLKSEKPVVENLYPLSNWKNIWANFCGLKIEPFDKDVIYKHLHVKLATNSRLAVAMMNLIISNTCNQCNGVIEQTAIHMIYECTYISPFYQWFLNILMQICNFKPSSNIRFLYFDSFYLDIYQKIICNGFLIAYICTVWKTRKGNMRIGILRNILIRKVKEDIDIRRQLTRQTPEDLYGQYYVKLKTEELDKL